MRDASPAAVPPTRDPGSARSSGARLWSIAGAGLIVGLLTGLLWGPAYGPYDPQWMQDAAAGKWSGTALSAAVAGAWVGGALLTFWAAQRRALSGVFAALAVLGGFAVVALASFAADPLVTSEGAVATIAFALAVTLAMALVAAIVWRIVRDVVPHPGVLLVATAAVGFCLAFGWFAQLAGNVVPDDAAWRAVGTVLWRVAAVALVMLAFATLVRPWAGGIGASALLALSAFGLSYAVTQHILRPIPEAWALSSVDPGGRALRIWVLADPCSGEPHARLVRRTSGSIEIEASRKPSSHGLLGCALMGYDGPAPGSLIRVDLDRPLDGERIMGPGRQEPSPIITGAAYRERVMPNVVGLSRHEALVMLGANRTPKTRVSRLRGQFAYRLGDVTFTTARGRVVTDQRPVAGTPLEPGPGPRRGRPDERNATYSKIALTTGK